MRVLVALLAFLGLWGMTAPPPALAHHEMMASGQIVIEAEILGSWMLVVSSDVGLTITVWVGSATGPATLLADITTTSPALNDKRVAPDPIVAASGQVLLQGGEDPSLFILDATGATTVRSDSAGATPYLRSEGAAAVKRALNGHVSRNAAPRPYLRV